MDVCDKIRKSVCKIGSEILNTLLDEVYEKLSNMVNKTDQENIKDVKRTRNYLSALSSHIDAIDREREFNLTNKQKGMMIRGNVVWVDFGFNIGTEFGGRHPAIILRVTSNYKSVLVLPIDSESSAPETMEARKNKEYWYKIDHVNGMKKMTRWANVYRTIEISSIRIDFSASTKAFIKYDVLEEIDRLIEKYQYKPHDQKENCAKDKILKSY